MFLPPFGVLPLARGSVGLQGTVLAEQTELLLVRRSQARLDRLLELKSTYFVITVRSKVN